MIQAKISLDHLSHNLNQIKSLLQPTTQIMPVIKANAYGHGGLAIFDYLRHLGYQSFAVARLSEAVGLRQKSKLATILILSPIHPSQFEEAVTNSLTLTLTDQESLKLLNQTSQKLNKPVLVHIKVDTGLHRSGCLPQEALKFLKEIYQYPNISIQGLFTHFAESDNHDSTFTMQQLETFQNMIASLAKLKLLPPTIHTANSAATILHPQTHFNLVRPGLALHGLFHSSESNIDLKPTLSLSSTITSLRLIQKGETVGYNRTFIAPRETLVATIAGGYADGLRRAPQPWPYADINGQLTPVIGRVSMDQISLDVTDVHPQPQLFQKVTLISNQPQHPCSVQTLANQIGTSNYELVSSLSRRIERVYI